MTAELIRLQHHENRIAMLEYSSQRMNHRIRLLEHSLRFYHEQQNRPKSDKAMEGGQLSPVIEEANDQDVRQIFRADRLSSSYCSRPLIADRLTPTCSPVHRPVIMEEGVSYSVASTQTDWIQPEEDDEKEGEERSIGTTETIGCHPLATGDGVIREEEDSLTRDFDMDELAVTVHGYMDDPELDNHDLYDDVEYEEVTLKRSDGCEKLGLTLCYGKGDDVDTDIFISEIEDNSIAFKNGRIHVGDQILQINGVDVHTRNEAIEQFRRRRNDITLLVARSILNCEDYTQNPMEEALIEERSCSVLREQTPEDDAGHFTDATKGSAGSTNEKDSGISRATDSDPELPPPIHSPSAPKPCQWLDLSPSNKVALVRPFGDIGSTESDPSNATTPTQANQWMTTGDSDTPKGSLSTWKAEEEASFERELRYLNEEIENIRLTCDRLIEQHAKSEHIKQTDGGNVQQRDVVNSSMKITKSALLDSVAPVVNGRPSKDVCCSSSSNDGRHRRIGITAKDETSSAYNTGNESCRSTPLKTVAVETDTRQDCSKSMVGNDGKRDSAVFTLPQASRRPITSPNAENGHGPYKQRDDRISPQSMEPLLDAGLVMYTNPENLQRTILLQQRLLREAMIQQAQTLRAHQVPQLQQHFPASFNAQCSQAFGTNWNDNDHTRRINQQEQGQCEEDMVKMEWKVKRRSDGSRYLTRRPIRNKLLKERAQKLCSERCGLSTDDDAWSELKIGKYWTREERKKHLERAKERKRRQEELLKRKAESLRNTTDQPILHLSNKKMLRRQGQQLFDKFTTVQEFLAHGSRTVNGSGRALGILSVTTV